MANLQPLMKSLAQSCDDDESAGSLNAMAARMDAVAGVQMANVNFYRAHEAAFNLLGEKSKAANCDARDEEADESDQ